MALGIRGGDAWGIHDHRRCSMDMDTTPTMRDMDTGQRQFYKNGNRTQHGTLQYFEIIHLVVRTYIVITHIEVYSYQLHCRPMLTHRHTHKFHGNTFEISNLIVSLLKSFPKLFVLDSICCNLLLYFFWSMN